MQGERAGATGARALKYWESTEEADHKASVCADLCSGVWVDQRIVRLLWGCCALWSSSGFHTGGASLYPAILACHGDLGTSSPLSLGQPSGDLSNVCRQSLLAARIDARTADHPAVSSWAVCRTESQPICTCCCKACKPGSAWGRKAALCFLSQACNTSSSETVAYASHMDQLYLAKCECFPLPWSFSCFEDHHSKSWS